MGRTLAIVLVLCSSLCACAHAKAQPPGLGPGAVSTEQFRQTMEKLASAWNAGNAAQAADCFAEDAIYMAPPNPRVRSGRATLFEFFGGAHGRPRPMKMKWHHLLFDEAGQIGAGEYTFEYEIRTHGVVMIKLAGGKISRWREYEVESSSNWEDLAGPSVF